MRVLIIINILLTFFCLCEIAALDNKLNRIIDNQDILKCVKKNKPRRGI